MSSIPLLAPDGSRRSITLRDAPALSRPSDTITVRDLYAAAHVIPRPFAENVPGAPASIDWDATLAFRRHLWSWGLGVADAMDTAQRNAGLDAAAIRELIRRSAAEAVAVRGALLVGVNTDDFQDRELTLEEVIDAYKRQLHFAEDEGAGVVLMASRHLARAAEGPAAYEHVYHQVIASAGAPVVLHWLGAAFDPALEGYFGSSDQTVAADCLLRIIERDRDRIAGLKMSLLDAEAEISLRSRLPDGIRMYTGDDFHYVTLIEGDSTAHSDALLGAFAGIAPLAASAVRLLEEGDPNGYRQLLEPTEMLSRHIFSAPTWFYKTGIAFLSWLNGHQDAFSMVGGLQVGRSVPHLSRIVQLADACGALELPELAERRWTQLLAVNGVLA